MCEILQFNGCGETFIGLIMVLCVCLYKLWDVRKKGAIHTFQNTYQVLAVTFNDTSDQILSGGIDNDIKVHPAYTENLEMILKVVVL